MRNDAKYCPFSGEIFRRFSIAFLALVAGALFAASASAQTGEPIKIGYSVFY
jgi:hypothetical protein